MNLKRVRVLVLCGFAHAVLAWCALDARAESCEWPASHSLSFVRQAGGETIQVREFDDSPGLHEPGFPDAAPYRAMREWIESKVNPDPIELLKRQRGIYASVERVKDAVPLFDRIIAGKLGVIGDISCLEALLINEQTALHPLESKDTEFTAMVMERAGRLRVYFVPGNIVGSGPSMRAVDGTFKANLEAGWQTLFHLHNHPFSFNNRYRDISGTTIPSEQDARVYREYLERLGLLEARITNGISTIRIPKRQFGELR